jgi:hypothetical protein
LDALIVDPKDRAPRLDQPGLGEPWDSDQQRVTAREQRDQSLLDHFALAEDNLADPFADQTQSLAKRLDFGDKFPRRGCYA